MYFDVIIDPGWILPARYRVHNPLLHLLEEENQLGIPPYMWTVKSGYSLDDYVPPRYE